MSGKGITREADLLHRDTVGITALRKGDHAQDPGVHTIGTNLPRFLVTLSLYYMSYVLNMTFTQVTVYIPCIGLCEL